MTIKRAGINTPGVSFTIWDGSNLEDVQTLFPECVVGFDSQFPELVAVVFPNGEGSFSFGEGQVIVRYDGGGAQGFAQEEFNKHFVVLDA